MDPLKFLTVLSSLEDIETAALLPFSPAYRKLFILVWRHGIQYFSRPDGFPPYISDFS